MNGHAHITLDPTLEDLVHRSLERSDHGQVLSMPPDLQRRIVAAIREEIERASASVRGRSPVVLVPPQIRSWIRRLIEGVAPSVAVLSYNEVVRGFQVESHGMVVLKNET